MVHINLFIMTVLPICWLAWSIIICSQPISWYNWDQNVHCIAAMSMSHAVESHPVWKTLLKIQMYNIMRHRWPCWGRRLWLHTWSTTTTVLNLINTRMTEGKPAVKPETCTSLQRWGDPVPTSATQRWRHVCHTRSNPLNYWRTPSRCRVCHSGLVILTHLESPYTSITCHTSRFCGRVFGVVRFHSLVWSFSEAIGRDSILRVSQIDWLQESIKRRLTFGRGLNDALC